MKLPVIRKLVQEFTVLQLRQAEEALLNEQTPAITIEGDDEGEQLTHIFGALEILESIEKGTPQQDALRAFTQRVRNSIS